MLLNTYAPPFKLVGGYFIAGIFFLALSTPAFFYADFEAISSLNTAGFLHIFFVGFVISIITRQNPSVMPTNKNIAETKSAKAAKLLF